MVHRLTSGPQEDILLSAENPETLAQSFVDFFHDKIKDIREHLLERSCATL